MRAGKWKCGGFESTRHSIIKSSKNKVHDNNNKNNKVLFH